MRLKLFGNISKIMLSATFAFLFLACAQAQPANVQTAAAPTAKSSTDSDTLKNVTIDKFGIEGLSLPPNMVAEPVKETKQQNANVNWTTSDFVWKSSSMKDSKPTLKVEISTTLWNEDFTKVRPELPPEFATPEYILLLDYQADLRAKEQSDSPLKEQSDSPLKEVKYKEVKWLELTSVRGVYVIATEFGSKDRLMTLWSTWRLLNNKGQNISIVVTCEPSEAATAEQIINSFKLSAK